VEVWPLLCNLTVWWIRCMFGGWLGQFVSRKPIYFCAGRGVWLSVMMPRKMRLRNDILFVWSWMLNLARLLNAWCAMLNCSFTVDPTERLTFWSTVVGGMFSTLGIFGVGQMSVQRYCSLPTLRQAQRWELDSCKWHDTAVLDVHALSGYLHLPNVMINVHL